MSSACEGSRSEPREARDVMTFGSEVGRVLSDGRIVGRAEPFAKVFPSSRQVKRVVGPAAWAVLEDIALDARLDDDGRLVAETNVRQIAANLGLGKNAVSRHLARLREFGFVLHEELRTAGTGRYAVSRYVLDPSACLERFTTTPAPAQASAASPERGRGAPAARPPCPRKGDAATASPSAGHREEGQNNTRPAVAEDEEQQPDAADGSAHGGLTALGMAPAVAAQLLDRHGAERVADAVAAVGRREVRNPPGWVVRALRDGWELPSVAAKRDAPAAQRHQAAEAPRQRADDDDAARARSDGWAAAVSAALPDDLLARAVQAVTSAPAGMARRSVPLARAQLVQWAAWVVGGRGGAVGPALRAALDAGLHQPGPSTVELPAPPAPELPAIDLTTRLRQLVSHATSIHVDQEQT